MRTLSWSLRALVLLAVLAPLSMLAPSPSSIGAPMGDGGTAQRNAADLPDLVITNAQLVTQNPPVGATVFFLGEIQNRGKADAGAFEVQLEGEISNRDLQAVSGLAADEKKNLFLKATLGKTPEVFTIIVDPNNRVEESDKSNNFLQLTVVGQAPPQPPPPPPGQDTFTWQWPDVSVTSGVICIFGICFPTGGSVNQVQTFPPDLSDGVSRLGVVSAQRTQSNLPEGLNFELNISGRSATLNGTVAQNINLQLGYDLLNSGGSKVGTLMVLINIILLTPGTPPGPTPPPPPGDCPGNICTLSFETLVQTSAGLQSVSGVPIHVNGVPRFTPFTISLPFGATITIQAPPSVDYAGGTASFKEWRSNVTGFISTRNPLTGRVDRSETIQAVYESKSATIPFPPVTLNVQSRKCTPQGACISTNVPIQVTTPSGATNQTTPFSVSVMQGTSITLAILQSNLGPCAGGGDLKFDRWTGMVNSPSPHVTFAVNENGTITAEYRCK